MKKILVLRSRGYDLTDYNSGTNLVTHPEDFTVGTNPGWFRENVTVTGDTTKAPDGNTTADTITPNTTNGNHNAREWNGGSVTTSYKISVFAKPNGYYKLILRESNASGAWASFDVQNGLVLDSGAAGGHTVTSTQIEDAGDGFYRCIVTLSGSGSVTIGNYIMPNSYTSGGISAWTPNGTDSMILWGAKVEQL